MATSQSTAFQQVLAIFKTKVDRELVSEFEMTTLSDLKLTLASIQRKHASDRRVRDMGRLSRFLDAMNQFGKVIEVFLNATDVLAFVWGPMKFLLQVANTCSEAFGKLLETYQIIGESLPLLDKCQGFLEDTPYVRQALESIFHDILEFHQYALGYFKKPMWQRLFQATWATYKTRFQPIVDNLNRHKDLLEGRVTFTQLETIISNGEKAIQEFQRQQRDEAMSNHRAVQAWLGNVDVETDHESIARVRYDNPEAGSWLLHHPLFQLWQDATSDTLLLWLNGIPGAGKSVLASLVIDKCREKASNVTIWFYCRHGDKGRSTFVALARALISQLLKYDMDLVPYVHEKMSSRSEQMLSSESLAKELLETLLKNCQGLYVILDGLDECARGEEKRILEWFRSVIESSTQSAATSCRPRCVFISQRDSITTRFLRGLPTIAITSSNNLHDITTFVSSWGRQIQEKFSISVDDTNSMNEMVVERAAGMFLFAKLVMTALFSQISREKLYNEVNVKGIPEGLEAAYSRVLDVVLEQTSRSEALQLLAWLVCAKRPLEWREIQAAVAIDIEGETVDFHGRQWMVNAKDLCGSLVETRSDGSLQLVHKTAKFYLIENGVINVCHEELKIACLCLGYLALPGFEAVLAESSVEDLLKIGYYAFVDYAACYWIAHLRAGLARGVPEQCTGMQIGHLERFIDSHYRPRAEDIQIPVATRSMLSCLQDIEICSLNRFEDFLKVFVATERQVETYGEGAVSNIALDIPEIIARIRTVLEDAARRESWDEIDRKLFTFFYGELIYKCPRISCSYFHHGFTSPKEKEAHIRKHRLPYSCSYPGCLRAALGFPSPNELQRHISQTHEMPQTKTQKFPSKQKRPVLQCGICQQSFSKPGQLRTHDCRTPAAPTVPARPGSPLPQEQFAAMTPQQRLQVGQQMARQQKSQLHGSILNRAAAEEAWNNNLPPKIMEVYNEISKAAPSPKPVSVSPDQKAVMTEQLRDSLDVLSRLDVLVVHRFSKMKGQERNMKNLLAMRIQLMRQFKPSQEWIVNDHFTITPDYLTGAILFIRKLFQVMNVRMNQQRPNTNQAGGPAQPAQPGQANQTPLDATNIQQSQQQEEALQRAQRASAPFGAPSPQGVPHAYGPGGLVPEKLKLPPLKKRKQSI